MKNKDSQHNDADYTDKFDLHPDMDTDEFVDDMDDRYDTYASALDPIQTDRQARRKRKSKVVHVPKKAEEEIIEEIVDPMGLESGFITTYNMTLYEEEFLLDSVRTFYERDLITDILAVVKGGKEANVYRCQAHESVGDPLVAVKVYRPRKFRNLRRDHVYRQGRMMKNADGKSIKEHDVRMLKAVDQRSSIGQQLSHTSWLMYEYSILEALYNAGADVPKPIANGNNALLMQYIGDAYESAPTLHEIRLHEDDVERLFERILYNVDLLLQLGFVHGDLSAYNILYWEGNITLIDFPQVVDINRNPDAYMILQRDLQRLCDYFARQGLERDATIIAQELWATYATVDPYAHVNLFEGKNEEEYEDYDDYD